MSAVYQGAAFTSISTFSYTADGGLVRTITERGIPSVVEARGRGWIAQGYDVAYSSDGVFSDCVATKVTGALTEGVFTQRWAISQEKLEKSLWSKPEVMTMVNSAGLAYGGRAGIKKIIEDSVNDNSKNTVSAIATANNLLLELRSGVETFEAEYTVLTREATYNSQNVLPPEVVLKLESLDWIFTTDQLISFWAVPPDVANSLPASSAAQEDTVWGWRLREQEADVSYGSSGVGTTFRESFVYAQWSTFLYSEWTDESR